MIKMVCPSCDKQQWRWKGRAWRKRHKCFGCDYSPLEVCRGLGARGPIPDPLEKVAEENRNRPKASWRDREAAKAVNPFTNRYIPAHDLDVEESSHGEY